MLREWVKSRKPDDEELALRLEAARSELAKRQIMIKDKKLPVLVVLDGWGAAGKGSVLGRIIKDLDPRFFKTFTLAKASDEEKRRPYLYRYFSKIPEAGKFVFYDGSWMDEVTRLYMKQRITREVYEKRLESIRRFERQLNDNGYLVVKFFFQIGREEQKKRLKLLQKDKSKSWRVDKWDEWQNRHY
ncbi:MAG: phosphate--AMP phosphotransferase, partial [Lachnospiraceae bacterium]|nr:phosphate--AMP phosphotransferase [Lachnospiraceae bacterium]